MTDSIKVREAGSGRDYDVITNPADGVHSPVYNMGYGSDGVAPTLVSSSAPLPVIPTTGVVSTANSTTTLLTDTSTFTGAWEDVSAYDSVIVAVKTDQNGIFTVQLSPDGSNQDSTLTRYYRATQIEARH